MAFLIDIFNIQEIEKIYFLRHFLIFLIFLTGIFYFYLILKNRFSNNYIIIFGLALLFFSPRIFANSFYNNKDLIFLSVSCIFFYYGIKFLDKPSAYNAIIFGSVGRELNPLLEQKLEKFLKSAL